LANDGRTSLRAQDGPVSPDATPSLNDREETRGADPSKGAHLGAPGDQEPRAPDAAALRAVAEAIVKEFPLVSEDTALVLYEVDPTHLQAQWQLNPGDLERARGLFPPEARAVRAELRLRRIRADGTAELVTSVPCNLAAPDFAAGARFSLRNDTAQYETELETELGLASEDGGWVALVRSNRTHLPPLARRGFPKEVALTTAADGGAPLAPKVAGGGSRQEGLLETGLPAAAGSSRAAETPHPRHKDRASASAAWEGPVEPALAAEGSALRPVFPNPLALGEEGTGPEGSHAPSASFASDVRETQSTPAGEALAESGEWARLPPPLLPSSVPEGQQDFPLYDPRTALSSHSIQDLPAPLEDMEVHAELLIYGRAAPGREIDLFGHRLQVGPKGYFFLRRAVDDDRVLAVALSDLPARLPEGSFSE
jgi:hypothetical protein